MHRSVKALDRISENLSIYQNVPLEIAKIIIKESIRNCPLFHLHSEIMELAVGGSANLLTNSNKIVKPQNLMPVS
jgi:hypothetical protein